MELPSSQITDRINVIGCLITLPKSWMHNLSTTKNKINHVGVTHQGNQISILFVIVLVDKYNQLCV